MKTDERRKKYNKNQKMKRIFALEHKNFRVKSAHSFRCWFRARSINPQMKKHESVYLKLWPCVQIWYDVHIAFVMSVTPAWLTGCIYDKMHISRVRLDLMLAWILRKMASVVSIWHTQNFVFPSEIIRASHHMGPCGWQVPHDTYTYERHGSHVRHVNWLEFC